MRVQTRDGAIYEVINKGGTRVLVDYKELTVGEFKDHCDCLRCKRFLDMKIAMNSTIVDIAAPVQGGSDADAAVAQAN
jgi:hypothetical protein